MTHLRRIFLLGALFTVMAMASGCGSLSMFSSRHVHYHGSEEADKKIDALEQRIEALEKAVKK